MFSIKKMLVDLYDSRTAQSCSASIGDIMNLRRNVEHNQFLATTRYLDIKDYVEYNKQTFVWQNTISRAAYGNKHREEEGNIAFSKLITSYQSKGYDPSSLFIVDEDMRLLDGNHRMGMNLYTDQHKINVRVLKRKSKNPSNLDWYLQKKISTDFLKKVYNAYLQIQEWLIETGDTFCCIVPENEKLSELDLMVNIKSVHRYRLQSPLFVGGGIKLNKAGKLIQFTLDEPEYMIEYSKAVSKRIRDIKNILEMRYGMEFVSQIYFSQSCLEGKEIFDKVKNDFIE